MFYNIIMQHYALKTHFLMNGGRKMLFTLSAKNYEE